MIAFYLAAKYCIGIMTLNQMAAVMGCQRGWSVTLAVKRVKELKEQDNELIKKLNHLEFVVGTIIQSLWGQAPSGQSTVMGSGTE